ncbi:MAG: hypothetical protein L6R37_002670 [Teloschistes peruensis]|nr:MAG: hypothetical protein L6R37_002670 [Teloschistes peruensis]
MQTTVTALDHLLDNGAEQAAEPGAWTYQGRQGALVQRSESRRRPAALRNALGPSSLPGQVYKPYHPSRPYGRHLGQRAPELGGGCLLEVDNVSLFDSRDSVA